MNMNKTVYTSYFANIRKLPSDVIPIGICIGENKNFPIRYDKRLAPTWQMLKMPRQEYDKHMRARLEKLDARQIYESFPQKTALICYEVFNDWCHRRMVAEWLEAELGIVVTEYGLNRDECFPYAELGPNTKGRRKTNYDELYRWVNEKEIEERQKQLNLFDNDEWWR